MGNCFLPALRRAPQVKRPRTTEATEDFEPDWDERLTVTVGQKRGDLIGKDDKVLQTAVDYRGGTVQILPGIYTLRNAVHLPSGIRLRGAVILPP